MNVTNFKVSVSRTYRNKEGYQVGGYRLNQSFKTETHTPASFVEKVIKEGWPYTMVHLKRSPEETGAIARGVKTTKHKENFVSSQLLTGDDDGKKQSGAIEFWKTDPFFSQYGFLNVESVNSVPGVREKCHPTILFDKPITDSDLYKECLQAFCTYYQRCDWLVNVDRTIYNAVGATVHQFGRICPFEAFEEVILKPYREAERQKQEAIDQERKQRELEYQKAIEKGLVSSKNTEQSYLEGYLKWLFDKVATCSQGTNRNTHIFWAGRAIAGIEQSPWTAPYRHLLNGFEDRIVEATAQNGYLKEYAHNNPQEVIRIFKRGIAAGGSPIDPPLPTNANRPRLRSNL